MSNESENKMSNERIDLQWLLEEDSLMQDLNWSIARFEQVEKLVKEMTAELKRCYERIDRVNESMKVTRERVLDNTEDWNNALFQEVIDALLLLD